MRTETSGAIIYLSAILAGVISSGETFEEAEAIYAGTFRSHEPISIKDDPESFDIMVECLMADIYPQEAPPSVFGDGCDDLYDDEREPLIKGMTREQAIEAVNGGARFFEICNYKGEGEGLVPEALGKNLRIFVKKWQYI